MIVSTNVNYSYDVLNSNLLSFKNAFHFLEMGTIGYSVLGRPIPYVRLGYGGKKIFYCGSFHANEWITTPILMKFIEDFCTAIVNDSNIFGVSAQGIFNYASIYIVPMVNPDGVDLVTRFF